MRLTNTDRDAFIKAVLDDVPSINFNEQARVAVQKWAIDHLPAKLKSVHKEFGHFFKQKSIWGLPGELGSVWVTTDNENETKRAMVADESFWESLKKMASDLAAQTAARNALESKVRACIYACTTIEQAHERMPEFAAYLKEKTPAGDRTVPVVANLVSDLVAAGWPKSKKVAARKAA